jgi:hypothetical protein
MLLTGIIEGEIESRNIGEKERKPPGSWRRTDGEKDG